MNQITNNILYAVRRGICEGISSYNFNIDNNIDSIEDSDIYNHQIKISKEILNKKKTEFTNAYHSKRLTLIIDKTLDLDDSKIFIDNKELINECIDNGAKYVVKSDNDLYLLITLCINNDIYDLNWIDVTKIDSLTFIFANNHDLGIHFIDISKWDVSNIKYMNYTFFNSYFNGDISNWDVSNVIEMDHAFEQSYFNLNISKWNVKNVITADHIFNDCEIKGRYKPKFNNNI